MITVLGATGNTGRVVAETLLDAGRKVRLFGRSADKLAALAARGAEVMEGDLTDAASLTRSFAGSEAAYTLIPPNYATTDYRAYQKRAGEALAEAVRRSGMRNVVLLSSIGAQHPSGTGPIAGLHEQEKRFKAIPGLNALFLRAAYFFENHFVSLSLIRHQGINGSAIRGDVPLATTASRDVGLMAAQALLALDFTGPVVRHALGPADLTMQQATAIIGRVIARPELEYVQFPDDAALAGMLGAGLPENMARLYLEMSHAVNEGLVAASEGRNASNTTTTRLEDFAEVVLAPAFRAL